MTNLDVLLIAPFRRPTFRQAISSAYPVGEPWDSAALSVAAALREAGFNVGYLALQNIFDAWNPATDRVRLHELLYAHDAKVVLFVGDSFIPSRSTATLPGIREVAEVFKDRGCGHIGVCGRLATTAASTVLLQAPDVDFCLIGEPEPVVADVVSARLAGRYPEHKVVVDRKTEVDFVPEPATRDLAQEPVPAWDVLAASLKAYDRWHLPLERLPFSLRTSVGCKFRCKFCAGVPNWLDYRTKPASKVAAELDALASSTYGRAQPTFLEDEIFTRRPEHVSDISRVFVERGVLIDGVYTHASLLNAEVAPDLAAMARKVYLGLDSTNNDLLRSMGKGQNTDVVLDAVGVARSVGIQVHLELIVGSPLDTVDSTVSNLTNIANFLSTGVVESAGSYVFCPHPGTAYGESPEKFGFAVAAELDDMQESGGYPAADIPGMTRQQVYVAYLMSQLVIADIMRARSAGWTTGVGRSSREEIRQIFENFSDRSGVEF